MSADIQGLIDKINQEGVLQAKEKAEAIEKEARRLADKIVEEAREEAERLKLAASQEIRREKESEMTLLSQAGRDTLLELRRQINAMLQKVIAAEVRQALTPEALAKIIGSLIEDSAARKDIVISLSHDELEKVQGHFTGKLKEEIKREVKLVPSDEVRAGFTISFDAGKSQFDFSDSALAEYIGSFLKPKLKEILG